MKSNHVVSIIGTILCLFTLHFLGVLTSVIVTVGLFVLGLIIILLIALWASALFLSAVDFTLWLEQRYGKEHRD